MDSLGGILIKGLLGNPILAAFNLFIFGITIEETPTPSPTLTPTATPVDDPDATPTATLGVTPGVSGTLPIITPTPTPVPGDVDWGGGGGGGGVLEPKKKTVTIRIRFKGQEHVSNHRVDERTLRISINIVGYLNRAKAKLTEITLKLLGKPKNIDIKSVKVKRHDD